MVINSEELNFINNSIGQRESRSYEAHWQKTSFLRRIIHYNLRTDYVKKQNDIINTLTVDRINELAKQNLLYEEMKIVVVGDKNSIQPGLERFGYEIVNVDVNGNIINNIKIDIK